MSLKKERMKKIITLIFILTLILPLAAQSSVVPYKKININDIEGVIFQSIKSKNSFIPSDSEIKNFECKIKDKGKSYNDYVRQYIGIIINNRKYIITLFIHKRVADGILWEKEFITVEGGGDNYINVKYDIAEDRIIYFYENAVE